MTFGPHFGILELMRRFLFGLFILPVLFLLFGPRPVMAVVGIQNSQLQLPPNWFIQNPISGSLEYAQNRNQPSVNNYSMGFLEMTNSLNFASILMLGPVVNQDKNGKITVFNINDPQTYADNGAAGTIASGIDLMIKNKPASSIEYIAYMGSKLRVPGSAEVAYAADGGYGFNALQPILAIWTVTRNLAYAIFAAIFVVIGLMIMFRVKIDPKTVASVQNALPKIVFALILVTFSYAIAGFLVDLMYVMMSLIFALVNSIPGMEAIKKIQIAGFNVGEVPVMGDLQDQIFNKGMSIFYFYFHGPGFSANLKAALAVIKIVFSFFLNGAPTIDFTKDVGGSIVGILQNIAGYGGGAIAGVLGFFVIAVMILWALFKTWLALLGAYANILLGIIIAPLRLMLDAIPGQNQFGSWIKDMLVNLLVFPLVTAMMLIGAAITLSSNIGGLGGAFSRGTGFVPPLIGGSDQAAVQALVGLAIILSIPRAIEMLREVMKAPAFKYGNAWSEAVAAGWGITKGAAEQTPPYQTYRLTKQGNEKLRSEDLAKKGTGPFAWMGRGFRSAPPSETITNN